MPQPTDAKFRTGDYVRDTLTKHCGEVVGYDSYLTKPYTVCVEMDHSFRYVKLPENRLEKVPRGNPHA